MSDARRPSDMVRELLARSSLAVLCTQGHEGPCGSLMATAPSADLCTIALATRRNTIKYRQMIGDERVALVYDDRPRGGDAAQTEDAIREAGVAMASGRAHALPAGAERDAWAAELISRHPYLAGFADDPSVAVFLVHVEVYEVVTRFERVARWRPTKDQG